MTNDSLLTECRREIKSLIQRYKYIAAVVICDREGACLIKVLNENELKNDQLCQQNFSTQNLASCIENVLKIELGNLNVIQIQYDDYQIVKFVKNKLMIAIFATNQIETGTLISLKGEFDIIGDSLQEFIK